MKIIGTGVSFDEGIESISLGHEYSHILITFDN